MICLLTGHTPVRELGKGDRQGRYVVMCAKCGKVYREGEIDAGFALSPREAVNAGYRDFEVQR